MSERNIFCKKCILSDGFLGIQINYTGLCNFCADPKYKNVNWSKIEINDNLKKRNIIDWNNLISALKTNHIPLKYDCVIGYSGGKDSTALLDLVINEYNLTPLAITVDTGFMTDIAKENIKDTLKKIGVSHIFIKDAIKTFIKLYKYLFDSHKSNVRALTKIVCDYCSDLLHSIIVKVAIEKKINLVLFGYSPDQIARYFYEIPPNDILYEWKPDFVNNEPFDIEDNKCYINSNDQALKNIPRVLLPFHVLTYQEDKIIERVEKKNLIKKGNADPLKTNCNVVAAALFYDLNRYGGLTYALQFAELVRQDPSIRKKWLRTIKMISPLIQKAHFKESGVKEFFDKIEMSKDKILEMINKDLELDPNKEKIKRNLSLLKKK